MNRLILILFIIGLAAFSAEAAVEEKAATLKSGANLSMGVNYVRYNTVLKADFIFSDFSSVMVGRVAKAYIVLIGWKLPLYISS